MELRDTPNQLYRYRFFVADPETGELPERAIEELRQAKLGKTWFSRVCDQNDPFDTNPHYTDSSIKDSRDFMVAFRKVAGPNASFESEDFVKLAKEWGIPKSKAKRYLRDTNRHIKIIRRAFSHYRDNAVISCFSEDPLNILMWSYYGNSHSSYCLRFERKENDLGRLSVGNVNYLEERPQINTLDMMRRMATTRYPDEFAFTEAELERVENATLLSKSHHWSHEKEWRGIKTPSDGIGYHQVPPFGLTGIYVGSRTTEQTVSAIRQIVGDIEVIRCVASESHYRLEVEY